jgi:SAM-dependent methyltransferase
MHKGDAGQELRRPESMTHQHLAAMVNTVLADRGQGGATVKVLDLGCGNGHLIDFMLSTLPRLRPDLSFDIFGLDVYDAGGQFDENMATARPYLSSRHPSMDWGDRLQFVSSKEPWPFGDRQFDIVISNQVLEHVKDHSFVFSEIQRTLKDDGISIHLFPLREVLWEGHVYMPVVHRAYNYDKMVLLMHVFAGMGFRKRYVLDRSRYGWKSLREFAEDSSVVILTETNYQTYGQLLRKAQEERLTVSFRFSKNYCTAKLLSFLGRRKYLYRRGSQLLDFFGFFVCKRITSVTMTLRKAQRRSPVGVETTM